MVLPGVLALLLAASAGVNADAGVTMFPNGSLSSLGLTEACELSLYNSIDCDPGVSALATSSYGGSLNNATLASLVCQATCGTSIAQLHDSVVTSCGTTESLIPGMSFLALVDQVWSNWNQSCLTDPTTGDNCNDIIAAFPDVVVVTDLPTADLCSYCNVQQLALLQANAYLDAYTQDWQSTYKAVAQACNLTVSDFDPVQSAFNVTVPSAEVDCVSGNTYTTKEGDTCDSIAQTFDVSAATMFYINPNIVNCSSIWAGTDLCLPQTCSSIYTVQANDTCLLTADVINFNSQLNVNCSNLVDPVPYWGSTLCFSTPGGTYTGQPLNTTIGDSGNSVVNPPVGSTVATGTTTDCGAWFVNDASLNLTCAQICLSNVIAINLFTEANPSLNKTTCDSDLVAGAAYCVDPLPGWDYGNSTSSNATTTTTTTTSVPAASTPEAPTQTGIASDCNKYYTAQDGDTCDTVAAKYGITTAQFLAWNPAISSDCKAGFWLEEAYCVGVSS
ncbi:LysM peptidoglycan-binding domain-containing protein [Aspergillus foveolatus]|uniref:LysM peptidoglycan-binding domain-containing protein n=1 Tax=Aspergillus foveolatus TaxID=210207 RepID=UPI003CCD892F